MNDNDHTYIEWLRALSSGCRPSNGKHVDAQSLFAKGDVQLALFAAVQLIESKLTEPVDFESQQQTLENLLNSETFPTAMEAAESIADVPFIGTSPRFSKGKWFVVDPPSVNCPKCKSDFLAFRSPYTTKAGHIYFYWALACPTCQTIIEPANLPDEDRNRVYKDSSHRPVKPDTK
jgi:hypothetical protein